MVCTQGVSGFAVGLGMASSLPSRAWSCQTLVSGLGLSQTLPMTLDALGEMDVKAMEEELAKLQVGPIQHK